MLTPLDPDQMPIPIILVSRSGAMTANLAFEDLHGRHEVTRQLLRRVDVAPPHGRAFDLRDLPWERVLRQDFVEEEIWYDRVTAARLRYFVHGRSFAQGGVLMLEDLSQHSLGVVEFVDAAARATHEPSLERTGATLATGVQLLIGADAVCVLVARNADVLTPLATSRADLPAGAMLAAVTAAMARPDRTIDASDPALAAEPAVRALAAAGLHLLVSVPMLNANDAVGQLAVAWRRPFTLGSAERRILDAASRACATALVHARANEVLESAELRRLRAAALAITDLSPLSRVLERLAEQACGLLDASAGAVGLLEPEGYALCDVAITQSAPPSIDPAAMRVFLEEVANDDRATCRRRPAAGPRELSCAGARLRIGGERIGGICLFGKRNGEHFTEDDARALELFCEQAALAIDYSRQLQLTEAAQQRLAGLHDELSAVIAHDMRSPISSMLLQIDLLMEQCDATPDLESLVVPCAALDRIRKAAQRLSRMAEDLLDASRIELGRVNLDRRPVSLPDAVGNLVAQLQPAFGARRVEIDAAADAPPVFADPLRLDEIITNLLENAVKYSPPESPIEVRIRREGGGAIATVIDRGPGIPPDELPKLFDRFFQAKRLREKKSGLGLGLYITKGLVEAHGGRIWVDSAIGHGTQFHVWLPSDSSAA